MISCRDFHCSSYLNAPLAFSCSSVSNGIYKCFKIVTLILKYFYALRTSAALLSLVLYAKKATAGGDFNFIVLYLKCMPRVDITVAQNNLESSL